MKFEIISNEIWLKSEMASPHFLCQLPFSVSEIEAMIGVEFEELIEDGLGSVCYAFISFDNHQVLLKGFNNRSIKEDFSVCAYMHSSERSPVELLRKVTKTFGIDESQLLELGEYMDSPKYILSRLDDNNNEVEINRFHDKRVAEYLRKKYEDRGHKQDYYVQEII
ncbi:hypothetical protein [Aliikangiella sp. IMCC44359]|uniref:hypothetical protein n=1 Tax=Aliikangiella sp. IMCC44359 TaxID=3459125 RepID=UPI00403ACA1A